MIQLKSSNKTIATKYENVTVCFTDLVGYTALSSTMDELAVCLQMFTDVSAGAIHVLQVHTMMDELFSMFDECAEKNGVEKIKTIGMHKHTAVLACNLWLNSFTGDAYMAAVGLLGGDPHVSAMIDFAQDVLACMHRL